MPRKIGESGGVGPVEPAQPMPPELPERQPDSANEVLFEGTTDTVSFSTEAESGEPRRYFNVPTDPETSVYGADGTMPMTRMALTETEAVEYGLDWEEGEEL